MTEHAALSGLEMLRALIAGRLEAPGMGLTLRFRLVEVAEGMAVFEGDAGPHLLNPLGTVHGGFALALIDSATGCAAHTLLHAGVGYTSVETRTNFTRPIRPDSGTLRCEGRVVVAGRQIITATATLTLPDGRIVAHGGSTIMVLPPRE